MTSGSAGSIDSRACKRSEAEDRRRREAAAAAMSEASDDLGAVQLGEPVDGTGEQLRGGMRPSVPPRVPRRIAEPEVGAEVDDDRRRRSQLGDAARSTPRDGVPRTRRRPAAACSRVEKRRSVRPRSGGCTDTTGLPARRSDVTCTTSISG